MPTFLLPLLSAFLFCLCLLCHAGRLGAAEHKLPRFWWGFVFGMLVFGVLSLFCLWVLFLRVMGW